jgi:uncharacterized protein
MPASLTYPGVYIEEVSSGVRTIMGVSTSVTAFVGAAKRGKINRAVHILSYPDYERAFGGLDKDSQMSYAVQQFFLNGGSDAWVVRIAKGAEAARKTLNNGVGNEVLNITAKDEGTSGCYIEVMVDYNTANPESNFNLTFSYASPDNPADMAVERFENLSMNSKDARYVVNVVMDSSKLVTLDRTTPYLTQAFLDGLAPGNSLSGLLNCDSNGVLLDITYPDNKLWDENHNQLRVSVNGLPPVTVILKEDDVGKNDASSTPAAKLKKLCDSIKAQVIANANSDPGLLGFLCDLDSISAPTHITMTSGTGGEFSTVRVLPGLIKDISGRLKLGALNGGTDTDAVAVIRPVETPDHGSLVSGTISAITASTPPHDSLMIGLDGNDLETIHLGVLNLNGATLLDNLNEIADAITIKVQGLKPNNPAYSGFKALAFADSSNQDKIKLSSGTQGPSSTVSVSAASTSDIAGDLKLLKADGAVATSPPRVFLAGGLEQSFSIVDPEAYNLFIADRSAREGIYALEEVDLFNILCLPGVTDPGILMDACSYCQERRAFMIIDSEKGDGKPEEPEDMIKANSRLPKSNYASVYYPWIKVADPLNSGKVREFPPSGTLAGLYARIDSTRGVWKAPAGTEARLVGAQSVEKVLTDLQNGTLNKVGVNCIRAFPNTGVISWGARTLRGDDQLADEYKYIPVRRLALYIEESLFRGTQWVVFEPNDEPLWAQIRLNIGAFMHSLFRQGAFQGKSPKDAYFVKCDGDTTTLDDINRGTVNIIVGFAPLKPAEFVVIKIQQMAGQIQT